MTSVMEADLSERARRWWGAERKTGLEPLVAHRQITFRAGWLEVEAA